MGKASRWFRAFFGLKNPNPSPNTTPKQPKQRRWSFVKSYREKSSSTTTTPPPPPPPPHTSSTHVGGGDDANKHAIAAAQAAEAVVRLTSNAPQPQPQRHVSSVGRDTELWAAAVVIQSHFRGYLARRALRALKALVKLQAHVRGHILRRKTSETMRCMQAMLRAQARARSIRAHIPESPFSSTKSCPILLHPGPPTPEKFEQFVQARNIKQDQPLRIKRNSSKSGSRLNNMSHEGSSLGSSWSDPRMHNPMWDQQATASTQTCLTDDDRAIRILEMDTGKPLYNHRRRSLFEADQVSHSYTTSKDSTTHQTIPSPTSCEVVQTLKNLVLPQELMDDGNSYCTAENSPQYCSATSQGGSSSKRVGLFTPTKSDGTRSLLSGYSDCPSYMAYTESSKAKMRSHSAPKQRPQYERTSSNKRYSIHGFGEHNPRANAQRASAMHATFTSKAYPGSGRLDRLGMPVRDSTVVYYSGYLN